MFVVCLGRAHVAFAIDFQETVSMNQVVEFD